MKADYTKVDLPPMELGAKAPLHQLLQKKFNNIIPMLENLGFHPINSLKKETNN